MKVAVDAYRSGTIRDWQRRAHAAAQAAGWYDGRGHAGSADGRNIGEMLALAHSELSEALEEHRAGNRPLDRGYYREDGKPEGFGTELADCVIRIFDLAEYVGVDLETHMEEKLRYNATRGKRHGGKRC